MSKHMFKFAEIGTDLNNLGITEATLIRFSRRFESRIKPMRDNLTQELRASNDPNTTMRAWIEVNLLAPLINKFTSLDVEDQFIPNANSIRTMQLQHITREQVADLIKKHRRLPMPPTMEWLLQY
jgi:hypothetical protein